LTSRSSTGVPNSTARFGRLNPNWTPALIEANLGSGGG